MAFRELDHLREPPIRFTPNQACRSWLNTCLCSASLLLSLLTGSIAQAESLAHSPTQTAPRQETLRPSWIGIIAPARSVDVVANLDGRLQTLHVIVGQQVRQGQALATLEARVLQEDLPIARAALDSAQAELGNAESQLQLSQVRLERLKKAAQAFSQEELDRAQAELSQAHSNQQMAIARVAERQGQIERLQTALQQTEIIAPFDGMISLRYLEAGSSVTSQTPIMQLMAHDELVVRFAVPAEQASQLRIGQSLNIALGDQSHQHQRFDHRAQISWIAPAVDVASQMVFAEAQLTSPHAQLRAGLNAWVSHHDSALAHHPALP